MWPNVFSQVTAITIMSMIIRDRRVASVTVNTNVSVMSSDYERSSVYLHLQQNENLSQSC